MYGNSGCSPESPKGEKTLPRLVKDDDLSITLHFRRYDSDYCAGEPDENYKISLKGLSPARKRLVDGLALVPGSSCRYIRLGYYAITVEHASQEATEYTVGPDCGEIPFEALQALHGTSGV